MTDVKITVQDIGELLQEYLDANLGLTLDAFRALHYDRNLNQPEQMSYLEVLLGGFELASDASSIFHRIDISGADRSNHIDALNSKFTKAVPNTLESQEYVFRYYGNSQTGQFYMVDHPTNMGTFNFSRTDIALGTPHLFIDVLPWILWGSAANDLVMTPEERLLKTLAGIPGKVAEKIDQFAGELAEDLDWFPLGRNAGTAGNDVLIAKEREERFIGFSGQDAVDYSGVTYAAGDFGRGVVASLTSKQGYEGWAKGDTFKGIENLIGSDWGDILLGSRAANVLLGGDGRDILQGFSGADYLDGGSGENTINAGNGKDIIVIHDDKTVVDGGRGDDTVISHLDRLYVDDLQYYSVETFQLYDSETTIARHIVGASGNDTLVGNRFDNSLRGNDGRDVLVGGAGDDGLNGSRGNDTYLFADGWGNDIVREEGGKDTVVILDHELNDLRLERLVAGNMLKIYSKTSDDILTLWNNFAYNSNLGFEYLETSDARIRLDRGLPLTGDDGDNSYQGTEHDDLIDLGKGNDWIYATGGRDTIIGGEGNDTLWGGDNNDTFIFEPGFGDDVVWEAGAYLDEKDSRGDVIEFHGFDYTQVRRELEFDGDVVLYAGSDTIYIPRQTYNQGSGNLVELVSFNGGATMSIDALLPYDGMLL